VAGPNQNLELALARWVLNELPPEDVPMVATEALVHGCRAMSIAVLAGLQRPTSADVEAELPALLEELRVSLPGRREALKIHVDAVARDIVLGVVTPSVGASRISSAADERDELWDQFGTFVGLAVEYAEENRPASELDLETVARAKALLAAGGLQITPD
jgi:hypothetical protein